MDVRNALILKPCALGDMILAVPAIRSLNQHYPNANVDLLTNEIGAIAAEGNKYIDNVLLLTKGDGADGMGKVKRIYNCINYVKDCINENMI